MKIEIEELAKEFGATTALHPVSLSIPSGALVALLGPSGSGKTTLLRILGGLEVPTSGRVLFDGQDATGTSVQDRRAGFVFQHYALFKHMTIFENIAYGLRARPRASRPTGPEIDRRVNKLLALIQLPDIARRYPAQLSGGQRQRVALARALAIEPRMLLLDEPFGALDARVRKELRAGLRAIHDQTGLTTVFVTHDQDEAMELADRVVVMSMGRIEQVGTPSENPQPPGDPLRRRVHRRRPRPPRRQHRRALPLRPPLRPLRLEGRPQRAGSSLGRGVQRYDSIIRSVTSARKQIGVRPPGLL